MESNRIHALLSWAIAVKLTFVEMNSDRHMFKMASLNWFSVRINFNSVGRIFLYSRITFTTNENRSHILLATWWEYNVCYRKDTKTTQKNMHLMCLLVHTCTRFESKKCKRKNRNKTKPKWMILLYGNKWRYR